MIPRRDKTLVLSETDSTVIDDAIYPRALVRILKRTSSFSRSAGAIDYVKGLLYSNEMNVPSLELKYICSPPSYGCKNPNPSLRATTTPKCLESLGESAMKHVNNI